MMQELLGGAGLLEGERKVSFNAGVLEGSPSSSSSTTTTKTTTCSEKLKCPRCDSSNTKFCYYNNYNLTQPRHFCKTCRRYWTKGGALRNIPMGGGCRKNKSTTAFTTVGNSTVRKNKTSFDIFQSNVGSGFDQEPPSNPILWGWPQNSQLLSFLKATQNLNSNSTSSSTIGSCVTLESAVVTGALNTRTITLDPQGQAPPIGLGSSLGRNNQQQQQQQHSFLLGEVQNTNCLSTDHSSPIFSSVPITSSLSFLEPTPIAAGELGYWNPSFSWPDLPATN